MKQTPLSVTMKNSRVREAMMRRGASLVEVLVILVILLVGLGTIIRIFPIGLGTLRTTETRTLAVQLANQQEEQLKADAQNLPQGISLAYFDSTGKRVFDATQDADSLGSYPPSGAQNSNAAVNPYYSDVNKYRFIDGEVVKVPPASITTDYGSASIYLVKFGPVFMSANAGNPGAIALDAEDYLRVYSAPLQEINAPYAPITGATPPDNSFGVRNFLRGQQSYLLDLDDSDDSDGSGKAHILFPPTASKAKYLISYSYDDGNGVYRSVDKQLGSDGSGAGTNGDLWETIVTPNGTSKPILPGSVRVYRLFTRVTAGGGTISWNPPANVGDAVDPYQYALLSTNFPNSKFANLGRIAFHPSAASYGQRNAAGQQAFTAYIDYSVLDWHILREDREVPYSVTTNTDTAIPVRATLGNWKRAGDPNPDNTLYDGMFGDGTDDIVVVNLQTGEPLIGGDYSARQAGDGYWINKEQNGTYRSGTIYINSAIVPSGSQIRILYKAEGDWGVSVQKAYSRYQGVASAFPPTDSPSAFTVGIGTGDSARVYFNRSEYNKSFVAQFRYIVDDGNGGNKTVQTQPQQVTLGGVDGEPFVASGGVDYAFAEINAADTSGDGIPDGANLMPKRKPNTEWSIVNNAAYGVSLKTRVVYRDANSGRGVNNADPSSGWRVQDVDTYLTRAF
jgi:type II secretory pathway pseudopilin PulG